MVLFCYSMPLVFVILYVLHAGVFSLFSNSNKMTYVELYLLVLNCYSTCIKGHTQQKEQSEVN